MKKLLLCLGAFCVLGLLFFTTDAKGQKYCKPTFSNGCSNGDSLLNFEVGTYKRTSGCSGGYDSSAMTQDTIKLYRGRTYKMVIQSGNTNSFACWLDFNKDGDFRDGGELLVSDNAAGISSITTVITIPEDATLQLTRMRVMVAAGAGANSFLNDTNACTAFTVGGEAEDYYVQITAHPDDARVIAINAPQQYTCASSAQPLSLVVQNYGLNTLNSIPLTFKIGSTTINETLSKTLTPGQIDTFFFTSTFNAAGGGTFAVDAYSNLSGDDDRENDTVSHSLILGAKPNDPNAKDIIQCGANNMYLAAPSTTSGTTTYWYKTPGLTDTAFYYGDSLLMPIFKDDTTFYVQSKYLAKGSLKTQYVVGTPRVNNIVFFDIKPNTTIVLDSFQTHFSPTRKDSVALYIKEGTYAGYEIAQSAWTYVDKATVAAKGQGNPSGIAIGGLTLEAGKTYGIMLAGAGTYAANELFVYSPGNNTYANNDLTLTTGSTAQVLWSLTNKTASRSFDGEVFYHYESCPSNIVPISLDYQEGVSGTNVIHGMPYEGLFKSGTPADPDGICVTDTLTYDVLPPKGMTISDYGTKWSITSSKITTDKGTTYSRFSFTAPSGSKNGVVKIYPDNTWKDSLLKMTVVVKNLAGCDSAMTRFIRVSVQPTSSFTPSIINTCVGSSISFTNNSTTGIGITYKWDFGISSSNLDTSSSPSPTYAYADPGTYVVSLVTFSTGCKDSVTATLQISAAPTGGDLGKGSPYQGYFFSGRVNDPDLGCVRDTLTYDLVPPTAFTNAEYGTKWEISSYSLKSTGGASTSSFKFNAPSASGSGSIVFIPSIADADLVFLLTVNYRTLNSNCTDSVLTRYISVTSSPTANFSYKGICAGEPTAFTDAAIVPPGLVVRRYDFGVNNAFATTANPTYTYTTPGEYTVTYTVTSKGGCDDIMKQKITIYADPTADFDMPSIVCAGNPAAFVNKSSGNGGTITRYKWTFTEGTTTPDTSAQVDASHTFTTSGAHTAKLEVWTDGGCNGSVTKTITVVDAPTASFPVTKGCINEPITFVNNSSGAVSYEWRFSDKDTIRTTNAVKTFKFNSSYSVTLVATSASGCRDSITRQIEFYEQPAVDFTSSSKCANQEITFSDATTVPGGGSPVDWKWSFDNGPFKTGLNVTHTFATAGTHDVKLIVTSDKGCADSLITTIEIEPQPTADVTLPGNACVDVAATFTNNTSGSGNIYFWDFGDGNTSTDASPVYTYTTKGNYQVKMVVTNTSGCKDSVIEVLPVGLGPEVPFKWCAVDKKVTFLADDNSFSTYEWDFGDVLGGTGTGPNPSYTYLATNGEYDVTLTVTDAAGCVGTYTTKVGTGDKANSNNCPDGINEQAKQALGVNIYPNPFSHQTLIEYELREAKQVRVSVWDATGKQIAVLSEGLQQAGKQQITLDANEHKLPAGLYMIRIETDGAVAASQVLRLE